MERKSSNVKRRRRYDASRRREQARRSQQDVIDAARRLFLADGFASTTIAAIAAEAGVSVETIYKSFGTKPNLLRAIRDQGLAGEGPVHAEQRSDEMRAAESDPRKVIENWSRLAMEVAPRTAPILLLVRSAAAVEPELATLHEEMERDHLARMAHNARYLVDGGHLRPGITPEKARDVLRAYSSSELYELLVLRQGWTVEEWAQFIAEGMIAALLPAKGPRPAGPSRRRGVGST
jgi:AcrR family transcriptional regulator